MKDFQGKKYPLKQGSWTIFLGLCKGCALCAEKCPFKALAFSQKDLGVYATPVVEVDAQKCTLCQICEQVCPDCALKVSQNA